MIRVQSITVGAQDLQFRHDLGGEEALASFGVAVGHGGIAESAHVGIVPVRSCEETEQR